jgi:hypothetical protein
MERKCRKWDKKMASLLLSFYKGRGLSLKEERRIFVLIKLQKYPFNGLCVIFFNLPDFQYFCKVFPNSDCYEIST